MNVSNLNVVLKVMFSFDTKVKGIVTVFLTTSWFVSAVLASSETPAGSASTEEGEPAPPTKIQRRNLLTPIEIADFFVSIDNGEFREDPRRRPVDPLKLQKLLYYTFSYHRLVTGENLWDIEKYPIIANYHGPFIRDVHSEYRGYVIEPAVIEIAQKRLESSSFNGSINIFYSTYLTFIDKTGKDLEDRSHIERPYEEARKKGLYTSISIEDIVTEFESPHQKTDFIKGLSEMASKGLQSTVERIIEELMISLAPGEIGTILDKFLLSSTLQLRIAQRLYPKELLSNVEAKDSLFGRPRVIEKVAIAGRLGDLRAKKDLAEIFEFFSCESSDLYGQTSAMILSEPSAISVGGPGSDLVVPVGAESDYDEIKGYAEYEEAQQQTELADALGIYQVSLEKGYARSGFEMAKIFIEQEKFADAKVLLEQAFEKGMLTATDLMMELTADVLSDDHKLHYLKERGDRGDPMGYYQLAKRLHQTGNVVDAIGYYKKALPFFGITELRKLMKKDPSLPIVDSSLSKKGFFEDIIELYHNEALLALWFGAAE